jgi:hypothetical protein
VLVRVKKHCRLEQEDDTYRNYITSVKNNRTCQRKKYDSKYCLFAESICGLSDLIKSDISTSQPGQLTKAYQSKNLWRVPLRSPAVPRLCSVRHIPIVETASSQLKPFEIQHLLHFQKSSERILHICTDKTGVVPEN